MRIILKTYERILRKYPFLTQSVQTSILMSTGDLIAQTAIEGKSLEKVNKKRTAQFAGMGLFLAGPALTTWYRILAKLLGNNNHKAVVLKKVVVDQVLFAPLFAGIFLSLLGAIQGKEPQAIVTAVKKNYMDILISNYKLWPWVQLGNFYLVPLRYQVLVVQVFAVFWNTYLSWKTQSGDVIKEESVAKL